MPRHGRMHCIVALQNQLRPMLPVCSSSFVDARAAVHRDRFTAAAHAKSGCDSCSNCTRLSRSESHSAAHPSAAVEMQRRDERCVSYHVSTNSRAGVGNAPAKLWMRASWRQGPKVDGPCRLECSALVTTRVGSVMLRWRVRCRPRRDAPVRLEARLAAEEGTLPPCAPDKPSRRQSCQQLLLLGAHRRRIRRRCGDAQSFAALVARSR